MRHITTLLISCMICCLMGLGTYSASPAECFREVSYSSISTNSTVVGVKSFMTVFVWKDLWHQLGGNNETLLDRFDFFSTLNCTRTISVGVENSSLQLFTQIAKFHNMHNLLINRVFLTDELCRVGNIFEDYDVLFLEPYRFSYYIRLYREHSGKRTNDVYINANDFYPIPIIPENITIWNGNCGSLDLYQANWSDVVGTLFDYANYSCSSPDLYDNQVLRVLHGYSNFSQNDISLVEKLKSISLIPNWEFFNTMYPTFTNFHPNLKFNASTSKVMDNLLPSSCHFCSATLCPEYHINDQHYWAIGENGIIFLYFLALFASGSFKTPIFKRRLCVPYLPILCFLIMIFFSRNVSSFCYSAFHYVSVMMCFWFVFCYVLTVIRFFYLKNLYKIVSNSKRIRFHKIMASSGMGLFVTGFLPVVLAASLTSYTTVMFVLDPNIIGLFRNINLLFCIMLGSLLGLGAVIMDAVANRRSIRANGKFHTHLYSTMNIGIMKFLLFDDPFVVRIDLISLFALLIGGLLVVLVSVVPTNASSANATRSLNTFFSITTTLICGGNVLIIEAFKKIFFKTKANTMTFTIDNLLLVSKEFYDLFKEYCEKEISMENLLLWEKLRVASVNFTKTDTVVSLEFLQELEQNFLASYSKFEVNIPSSTRKEINALILKQQVSTDKFATVTVKSLMDIMYSEILINMSDTLSRLQKTAQYQKWEDVFTLQQSQNIL